MWMRHTARASLEASTGMQFFLPLWGGAGTQCFACKRPKQVLSLVTSPSGAGIFSLRKRCCQSGYLILREVDQESAFS